MSDEREDARAERDDAPAERDDEDGEHQGGTDADDREAPLSGLRERVEHERTDRETRADEDAFDELFTEMDAQAVESDELWDELLAAEGEAGPVVRGERVETDTGRDVRVVDDSLCHRCRYFGDPPELHCTHEGTDILEVVDVDRYKVADCPMVAEDDPGPDEGSDAERG